MSRPSQTIKLRDMHAAASIDAVVYEGISEQNLKDFEREWRPVLRKARDEARLLREQGIDVTWPEDAHWEWSLKVDALRDSIGHKHFAIECEGMTQGLMQLDLTYRSWADAAQHIIYIDLLSVAPWNRNSMTNGSPRFKGAGTVLFAQAIGTSFEEGFEGRVGLHALAGSASWYREKLKMTSYGPDPKYVHPLEYFEYRSDQAKNFMARLGQTF